MWRIIIEAVDGAKFIESSSLVDPVRALRWSMGDETDEYYSTIRRITIERPL